MVSIRAHTTQCASTMVSIRARTTRSSSKLSASAYAVVIPSVAIVGIILLLRTALLNQGTASAGSGSTLRIKEQLDKEAVDPLEITKGSVTYDTKKLPYYHCGPLPSHDNPELTELVLLHSATFTKEKWKESGILDMLCKSNNEEEAGNISVSALDLPVSADGAELASAFDALASQEILSGRAATFVSPSASGNAILSLAEMAANGGSKLARIVKRWIPVASGGVLPAPKSTLLQFNGAKIPILAIHGDKDANGKKVTQKLSNVNRAKGVELKGRHPVYLDSSEDFVQEILRYLDEDVLTVESSLGGPPYLWKDYLEVLLS